MLQKPNVNISRLMELADIIEGSTDYDQSDLNHCICGKACKKWAWGWSPISMAKGAEILGLSEAQGRELFGNTPTTPAKTARVLRHLAVTGEVEWELMT